jgi:hypothetical protein
MVVSGRQWFITHSLIVHTAFPTLLNDTLICQVNIKDIYANGGTLTGA